MANCCQKCSISASLSELAVKFLHFVQHCTRIAGFAGISVADHATLVGQGWRQSWVIGGPEQQHQNKGVDDYEQD